MDRVEAIKKANELVDLIIPRKNERGYDVVPLTALDTDVPIYDDRG